MDAGWVLHKVRGMGRGKALGRKGKYRMEKEGQQQRMRGRKRRSREGKVGKGRKGRCE